MELRLQQQYLPTIWSRYGAAVALFVCALLLRWLLLPVESRLAFSTFYPAVVIALYLCGLGPGAVVSVLSAAAGIYFFSLPDAAWGGDPGSYVGALAFLLGSAMTGWVVHRLRSTSRSLRAALTRLADVSDQVQDLYDHAPCGYYSVDARGLFVRLNATQLGWLACAAEDVVGKLGPRDFFTAQGVIDFNKNFPNFMSSGHVGPLEFDLLGRDGTHRHVSMSATAIRDASGAFVQSRSVMHDITEVSQFRRDLLLANRQQETMLDNELVGIVKLKDRKAVWENRALAKLFGYEPGELTGQPSRQLYLDDESYEAMGQEAYQRLSAGGTYRTQLRMRRKDGQPVWIDASGAWMAPETGETMWMMLDITAMKDQHERVQQVAYQDGLTGLPNRLLLDDRLQQAIPLAARLQSLVAVCFIDLDGFKAVNDQLGHAAGDRLLQVVAHRLQDCVRGNDTVARLGGDEFVLLLTHLQNSDECHQILARVAATLSQPVDVGAGVQGQVSASIGVAYCPADGTDGAQLLKRADEAMYANKLRLRDTQPLA